MIRDLVPDLLLGGACVGCGAPGRAWCLRCRAVTTASPRIAWPTPCPPGLVPPWTAGAYDDPLRPLVIAHKERGNLALTHPLGLLLARAVAGGVPSGPVLLVPVPSRWTTVRRRGHAPTARMTRAAGRILRDSGRHVRSAPLLALRVGVADQAGLGAEARHRNLAGSMWCPPERLAGVRGVRAHVVICDDVLTTGATAREAQRALAAVGIQAAIIATVAATTRRLTPHMGNRWSALGGPASVETDGPLSRRSQPGIPGG